MSSLRRCTPPGVLGGTLPVMSKPRLEARTPCVVEATTGADGYPLRFRTWRPEAEPRASIVMLGGIISNAAWHFPLVDAWTDAGFTVVGADRRGSGLNELARGDAPSAAAVIEDAMAVIDAAVPAGQPLLLVGWCWGSILALNLLKPLRDRLTGLVLAAPGLFPSQQVQELSAHHEAEAEGAAEDDPAIASPITEEMFTTGPYLGAWILRDEQRLRHFTPRFRDHMRKLGMGAAMALRKIDIPTLVLLADDDAATDNAAVREKMSKLPEDLVRIETTSGAHAIQFENPEFFTSTVTAFFERV